MRKYLPNYLTSLIAILFLTRIGRRSLPMIFLNDNWPPSRPTPGIRLAGNHIWQPRLIIISFLGKGIDHLNAAIIIPHSRLTEPVFAKISTKHPDIKFIQLDLEYFAAEAAELGVTMVPTLKYFNEGNVVCTVKSLLFRNIFVGQRIYRFLLRHNPLLLSSTCSSLQTTSTGLGQPLKYFPNMSAPLPFHPLRTTKCCEF